MPNCVARTRDLLSLLAVVVAFAFFEVDLRGDWEFLEELRVRFCVASLG